MRNAAIHSGFRQGFHHTQPREQAEGLHRFAGKGKERPLSNSTVKKSFYSFFIFADTLEDPLNYGMDEIENP